MLSQLSFGLRCSSTAKGYLEDNEQEQHHLVDIAAACDDLGSEVNTRATLTRAGEIQPLVEQLDIVHNKYATLFTVLHFLLYSISAF